MLGVEVPDPQRVIVGSRQEVVVFGVDCQVGNGVAVAFEHFDDFVLVDGPIQHHVVLFCGYDDCVVVVSM